MSEYRNDEALERLLDAYMEQRPVCADCGHAVQEVCTHGVCKECHDKRRCIGCGQRTMGATA